MAGENPEEVTVEQQPPEANNALDVLLRRVQDKQEKKHLVETEAKNSDETLNVLTERIRKKQLENGAVDYNRKVRADQVELTEPDASKPDVTEQDEPKPGAPKPPGGSESPFESVGSPQEGDESKMAEADRADAKEYAATKDAPPQGKRTKPLNVDKYEKSSSVRGIDIVDNARRQVGSFYEKDSPMAQCALWVRNLVTGKCATPVGNAKDPLDKALLNDDDALGPGFANSFFDDTVGTIKNKVKDLSPGDIVGFANTFGGSRWKPGVFTHVGVFVGAGRVIHRSSSGEVREELMNNIGKFAAGVTPWAYSRMGPKEPRTAEELAEQNTSHMYRERSRAYSIKTGLNNHFAFTQILGHNTGFNPNTIGENKELGLGQIPPDTVREILNDMGMQHTTDAEYLENPNLQMDVAKEVLTRLNESPETNNNWIRIAAAFHAGLTGLTHMTQNPDSMKNEYEKTVKYVSEVTGAEELAVRMAIAHPDRFLDAPDRDPYRFHIHPPFERQADTRDIPDEINTELHGYWSPFKVYQYYKGKNGEEVPGAIDIFNFAVNPFSDEGSEAWEDVSDTILSKGWGLWGLIATNKAVEKGRDRLQTSKKTGIIPGGVEASSKEMRQRILEQRAAEEYKFRSKSVLQIVSLVTGYSPELNVTEKEELKFNSKMGARVYMSRGTLEEQKGKPKITTDDRSQYIVYVENAGWDERTDSPIVVEPVAFDIRAEAVQYAREAKSRYSGELPYVRMPDDMEGIAVPHISGPGSHFSPRVPDWDILGDIGGHEFGTIQGPQRIGIGDFSFRAPDLGGNTIHPNILGMAQNFGYMAVQNTTQLIALLFGTKWWGTAAKASSSMAVKKMAPLVPTSVAALWAKISNAGSGMVSDKLKEFLSSQVMRFELELGLYTGWQQFHHYMSRAMHEGTWSFSDDNPEKFAKAFASSWSAAMTDATSSITLGVLMQGGAYGLGTVAPKFLDNMVDSPARRQRLTKDVSKMDLFRHQDVLDNFSEHLGRPWSKLSDLERKTIIKDNYNWIRKLPLKAVKNLERAVRSSLDEYLTRTEAMDLVLTKTQQANTYFSAANDSMRVASTLGKAADDIDTQIKKSEHKVYTAELEAENVLRVLPEPEVIPEGANPQKGNSIVPPEIAPKPEKVKKEIAPHLLEEAAENYELLNLAKISALESDYALKGIKGAERENAKKARSVNQEYTPTPEKIKEIEQAEKAKVAADSYLKELKEAKQKLRSEATEKDPKTGAHKNLEAFEQYRANEYVYLKKRAERVAKDHEKLVGPESPIYQEKLKLEKAKGIMEGFHQFHKSAAEFYLEQSKNVTVSKQGIPEAKPDHYLMDTGFVGHRIDDLEAAGLSREESTRLTYMHKNLGDAWNSMFDATAPEALRNLSDATTNRALSKNTKEALGSGLASLENLLKVVDDQELKTLDRNASTKKKNRKISKSEHASGVAEVELKQTIRDGLLEPLRRIVGEASSEGRALTSNQVQTALGVIQSTSKYLVDNMKSPRPLSPITLHNHRAGVLRQLFEVHSALGDENAAQMVALSKPTTDHLTGMPVANLSREEVAVMQSFSGHKRVASTMLAELKMHTGNMSPDDVIGLSSNLLRVFNARTEQAKVLGTHVYGMTNNAMIRVMESLPEDKRTYTTEAGEIKKVNLADPDTFFNHNSPLYELADALDPDNIHKIGEYIGKNPDFAPILNPLLLYRNMIVATGSSIQSNSMIRRNYMTRMFPRLKRYLERKERSEPGARRTVPSGEYKNLGNEVLTQVSNRKKGMLLSSADGAARSAEQEIKGIIPNFKDWDGFIDMSIPDRVKRLYGVAYSKATPDQIKKVTKLGNDLLLKAERDPRELVSGIFVSSHNADNQTMMLKAALSFKSIDAYGTPLVTFDPHFETHEAPVGKRTPINPGKLHKEAAKAKKARGDKPKSLHDEIVGTPDLSSRMVKLESVGITGWEIADPHSGGALRPVGDLYVHPQFWQTLEDHMVSFDPNWFDKTNARLRNTMLTGSPLPYLFQQFGQVYKASNMNLAASFGMVELGSEVRRNYPDLVASLMGQGLQFNDYMKNVIAFSDSAIMKSIREDGAELFAHASKLLDEEGPGGHTVRASLEDTINAQRFWHHDTDALKAAAKKVGVELKDIPDKLLRGDAWLNNTTTFDAIKDAAIGAAIAHTNRIFKTKGPEMIAAGRTVDEAYSASQRLAADLVNQQTGALQNWFVSSEARRNMFRGALTSQWTMARITAWMGWMDEEVRSFTQDNKSYKSTGIPKSIPALKSKIGLGDSPTFLPGQGEHGYLARFRHLSPDLRDIMRREYRWMAINGVITGLTWANALSFYLNGRSTAENKQGRIMDVEWGDMRLSNPLIGHDRQFFDMFVNPVLRGVSKAMGADIDETSDYSRLQQIKNRGVGMTSPLIKAGLQTLGSGPGGINPVQPGREMGHMAERASYGLLHGAVGGISEMSSIDKFSTRQKSGLEIAGAGVLGIHTSPSRTDKPYQNVKSDFAIANKNLTKDLAVFITRAVEAGASKNWEEKKRAMDRAKAINDIGWGLGEATVKALKESPEFSLDDDDGAFDGIYRDGRYHLSENAMKDLYAKILSGEDYAASRSDKKLRHIIEDDLNKKYEGMDKNRIEERPSPLEFQGI